MPSPGIIVPMSSLIKSNSGKMNLKDGIFQIETNLSMLFLVIISVHNKPPNLTG